MGVEASQPIRQGGDEADDDLMDARSAFRAESAWLVPDLPPDLWRELDRACFLPAKAEPVLLARLEDGTARITARYGALLDAPQATQQRWTAILIAWHCCWRWNEWGRIQEQKHAAEAAALRPKRETRFRF